MNGDIVNIKTFHGTDESIVVEGTFGVGRSFISDTSKSRVGEISDEVVTFEDWKLSGITLVIGATSIIYDIKLF